MNNPLWCGTILLATSMLSIAIVFTSMPYGIGTPKDVLGGALIFVFAVIGLWGIFMMSGIGKRLVAFWDSIDVGKKE